MINKKTLLGAVIIVASLIFSLPAFAETPTETELQRLQQEQLTEGGLEHEHTDVLPDVEIDPVTGQPDRITNPSIKQDGADGYLEGTAEFETNLKDTKEANLHNVYSLQQEIQELLDAHVINTPKVAMEKATVIAERCQQYLKDETLDFSAAEKDYINAIQSASLSVSSGYMELTAYYSQIEEANSILNTLIAESGEKGEGLLARPSKSFSFPDAKVIVLLTVLIVTITAVFLAQRNLRHRREEEN